MMEHNIRERTKSVKAIDKKNLGGKLDSARTDTKKMLHKLETKFANGVSGGDIVNLKPLVLNKPKFEESKGSESILSSARKSTIKGPDPLFA